MTNNNAFEYRGAIALNNMAVSLLERDAFKAALDTFKDAIAAVKFVYNTQNMINNDIQDKLHRAVKRTTSLKRTRTGHPICVVSRSDDDLAALRDAVQPSSSFVASPIRIDTTASCCSERSTDSSLVDLDAALLLYNFSVAHVCLAVAEAKLADRLLACAQQTLHSALCILVERLNRFAEADSDNDTQYESQRLLLLQAIVLRALLHVEHLQKRDNKNKLNCTAKAAAIEKRLACVLRAVEEMDSLESPTVTMASSFVAAAAA